MKYYNYTWSVIIIHEVLPLYMMYYHYTWSIVIIHEILQLYMKCNHYTWSITIIHEIFTIMNLSFWTDDLKVQSYQGLCCLPFWMHYRYSMIKWLCWNFKIFNSKFWGHPTFLDFYITCFCLQGIWIAGNIAMFIYGYLKYKNSKEFYYLRFMVGVSCYVYIWLPEVQE